MDLFDLLWQVGQDREISDIRRHFEQVDRDRLASDLPKLEDLSAENTELKLRLAILVRLMIAKGIITAQEYSSLVAKARPTSQFSDKIEPSRRAHP